MSDTFIFDDNQPQPAAGSPAPAASEPNQPEGGGVSRTFLIAAIVLGSIVLLSLLCMAIYALLIMPGQKASAQATSNANAVGITQAAVMQQQTQAAALFTPTLPPTETAAPVPTETLVVVFASATPSVVPSTDPATATVAALQTQLAISQATNAGTKSAMIGTTGTPGKQLLARTGFADEVGLPGLFIAAIIVIAIFMLARRLRKAPRER